MQCCRCGMVYLGESVSYEAQAREYDWHQTFPAESKRRDRQMPLARTVSRRIRPLRRLWRKHHGARLLRLVQRYKAEGRLCDFGCGTGRLLVLASSSFQVCGIDISQEAAALARQRLPHAQIIIGPVTTVRLPDASFDVVTMLSYLEHEQHPMLALQLARNALKPGGVVAVKTPNYGSWNRRVRGWKWCGFRFPDHCNYFTRTTLVQALQTSGFRTLPGSLFDCMPTSDNIYLAARPFGGT